jgi:hypothetical protein
MNVWPVETTLPTTMPGVPVTPSPSAVAFAPFSENAAKDFPRPRYRAALSTRARLEAPFLQATSTTMARTRTTPAMRTAATVDWTGHGTRSLTSPAIRSIGCLGGESMPAIQDPRWAAA